MTTESPVAKLWFAEEVAVAVVVTLVRVMDIGDSGAIET
jgi:hypothetical protein